MTKFGNKKTSIDGFKFDSQAEARRYRELRVFEFAGVIRNLEMHPVFAIKVNGKHVCKYYADFAYWDNKGGKRIVEDVKGVRTAVYKLKKKMVEAMYSITITEIAA